MENNPVNLACDFCDGDLRHDRYSLKACRYAGLKVMVGFYYQLCQNCYPTVQRLVGQALTEVFMQILQEETAKLKQELQAAGKI